MENIQKELLEIKKLIKGQNILSKEILTLEEASIYLSQSKSSLYKMTSKKEIPHYVPGGKMIYFKRLEIDDWIISSRVSTKTELRAAVDTYLSVIREE